MGADQARRRIVLLSLATTTAYAFFLIVSPLFLQVSTPDAYRLFQIIFPVFAGYLGSAVLFLFQKPEIDVHVGDPDLLRVLVHGAFVIFWLLGAALFVFYYISNLPGGIEGMKIDELSNYLTTLIAFMNITVGALTAFLFRADPGQFARFPLPQHKNDPQAAAQEDLIGL